LHEAGYTYFDRPKLTPAEEKRLAEGRRIHNERQEYRREVEEEAQGSGGAAASDRDRRRAENKIRSRKKWMNEMDQQYAKN
jgi:hypothetical protein